MTSLQMAPQTQRTTVPQQDLRSKVHKVRHTQCTGPSVQRAHLHHKHYHSLNTWRTSMHSAHCLTQFRQIFEGGSQTCSQAALAWTLSAGVARDRQQTFVLHACRWAHDRGDWAETAGSCGAEQLPTAEGLQAADKWPEQRQGEHKQQRPGPPGHWQRQWRPED